MLRVSYKSTVTLCVSLINVQCETVTLIGWNHCQREVNMTIFSLQDLPKEGNYGS